MYIIGIVFGCDYLLMPCCTFVCLLPCISRSYSRSVAVFLSRCIYAMVLLCVWDVCYFSASPTPAPARFDCALSLLLSHSIYFSLSFSRFLQNFTLYISHSLLILACCLSVLCLTPCQSTLTHIHTRKNSDE